MTFRIHLVESYNNLKIIEIFISSGGRKDPPQVMRKTLKASQPFTP